MSLGTLISDIIERLRALPTGVKVVLGVAIVAVLGVGSVFMYRTYNYVQHDNQFCLECHLMRDPFERFAQSAHQGLGCKACHRPNIIQRSEMGLTQIVEQPDSISAHARVPNEICAECHIRGNPEEWRIIANTAGHKVHLQSDDPSLQGLTCVKCHSNGVHQFTTTDQTCGQAGCHEDTRVRLGKMANLTIHCATCHDFTKPVVDTASGVTVANSLRPEAQECLSCHQMRALLPDLPPDEPHHAECGACHNPHTQTSPRQAVQSCTSGGCHSMPDTLTPMHRDLDPGVLENCLNCHKAHEFRIHGGGQDCLSCHTQIYQDGPSRRQVSEARPPSRPVQLASAGPLDPALARLALAAHTETASDAAASAQGSAPGSAPMASAPTDVRLVTTTHPMPQRRDSVAFWHSQHQGVECTACHSTQNSHGALKVTSIRDCQSCHHTPPNSNSCQTCHTRQELDGITAQVRRTMNIQLGSLNRPTRTFTFRHAVHDGLQCSACHSSGLSRSAAEVDCDACHERHHVPTNQCMACHAKPREGVHNLNVHLGCGGSGCHESAPAVIKDVPRTRNFCTVCHQDMTDHRPGRNCVDCHTLPSPQRVSLLDRRPGPQNGEMP